MARRTLLTAIAVAVLGIPLVGSSQNGVEYAGLETCASCHGGVAASFGETAHADSLEVLVAAGSDGDPECLACHVTGLKDSTYVDGAVTCEACHGPGGEHAATGDAAAIKAEAGEASCTGCHTEEWSPDFDYETYRSTGMHGVD